MQKDEQLDVTGKKYLLDRSKLKPGDIVLQAGCKLHSKIIATITRGPFSHAMIYFENVLIHAIVDVGVFSKNPQRILVKNPSQLAVYRMKESLTEDKIREIEQFVRGEVGCTYSMLEAFRTMSQEKCRRAQSNKQFCSRLVAQAYGEIGINLVEKKDYCSPNDISRSPMLVKIDHCVREANQDDIAVTEKPDLGAHAEKETMKWLVNVRKYAKSKFDFLIHNQDSVSAFVIKYPESSQKVVEFLLDTDYTTMYKFDNIANPYRHSKEACHDLYLSDKDNFRNIIEDYIKFNSKISKNHACAAIQMYTLYSHNSKDSYHFTLYRMHSDIACFFYKSIQVMESVCREHSLQDAVILAQQKRNEILAIQYN